MFEDVKDLKVAIEKNDEGQITKIVAGDSTYNTVEDAVKGIAEKDAFIAQLKAENAETRGQLKGKEDVDSLLKNLKDLVSSGRKTDTVLDDFVDDDEGENKLQGLSKDEIMKLAKQVAQSQLEERDKQQLTHTREERQKANRDRIRKELVDHYGSETAAKEAFSKFTSSEEFKETIYMDMLADTPSVLSSAIKAMSPKKEPVDYGLNTRRNWSESSTPGSDRNWAYFSKLRAENPKKYYSPEVQREIRGRYQNDANFKAEVDRVANS